MPKAAGASGWKEAFAGATHRRLRSWGINTIGNWSSAEVYALDKTPYTVPVGTWGTRRSSSGARAT